MYYRISLLKFISTQKWKSAEKKAVLMKELADQGILIEALKEEVDKEMDEFDLICHIAYDQPPLTRKERANQVRKRNYFGKYGELAQQVIQKLLDKYEEQGLTAIEKRTVLKIKPFSEMGMPLELANSFGGIKDFDQALKELENEIYQSA